MQLVHVVGRFFALAVYELVKLEGKQHGVECYFKIKVYDLDNNLVEPDHEVTK